MCIPLATPVLNPDENVWQYLRQPYHRNRVFKDNDAIAERVCQPRRAPLVEVERIESVTDHACVAQYSWPFDITVFDEA